MKVLFAVLSSSLVFAGCATESFYQLDDGGPTQARLEAENAHAVRSNRILLANQGVKIKNAHFPDFPAYLQQAGISGEVTVVFVVEADGSVSNARVLGTPSPGLAASSLNAIQKWKFFPMKSGETMQLAQTFVYDFAEK